MAARKDMRRGDLIPAAKESPSDFGGTLGSTLPMAAMFTRNKLIGWYVNTMNRIYIHLYVEDDAGGYMLIYKRASVLFAIQNWLGESPETRKTSSQPAYFSVGMSFMALVITYLPMFLPPPPTAPVAQSA
ncbi:hypothetical protein BOTNAR_0568g00050 [Botryotinia narcissicola]|uniref:Uncharacterized protein n=1 Tax=Botryotinia narcissicola TaxID=278944 RepID=A0A4Z1HCH4_9HELO|nr:hypothetical protein BOTNAR_0568g00050 [Botryotinia narcissicola]